MGVFGDTLRQARVSKGVTLREAEQATRINRHHLAALEDEDFAVLPPLIYQRGIVRNYSAYLDLDPGKTLSMFDEARGGETAAELVAAVKPLEMPRHWSPNFAIIAFMVVMGAVIFAWVYSISFSQEPVASTVPPAVPTVTPIPDDRLALPSPTPVPTATPPPIPTATVAASATAVPIATQALGSVPPAVEAAPPAEQAQQAPVAPVAPREAAPGMATIRVVAEGDIQVTVVADGAVVFSGWLGAGGSTEWYSAALFEVTTTNGGLTLFENAATGEPFYMGFGQNETYFLGG
ncbi:MAG: helix-turn-helix domain-containing protein [Chloroflexia bacterium]|nr:helix-turn-helix domain-containing protein [Chloroflexia bacterium]